MKQGTMWAWIVGVIVVVVGIIYLVNMPASTSQTSYQTQTSGNQGRVVFSVADAAVSMSNISEVTFKVSQVQAHSTTDGWVTVSSTPHTFNLLTLNAQNKSEILADANINAGTYDQVRLIVDSVTVTKKDGTTKTAKLPSGTLTLKTNLVVNADHTASLNFDILASKSLHMTGNGTFIFTPVVKTEAKSDADVNVETDGKVDVSGGKTEDNETEGMDVDGSVKSNFQINDSEKLDIDSNNMIHINGETSSNASGSANTSASANTGLQINGSTNTGGTLNVNGNGSGTIQY